MKSGWVTKKLGEVCEIIMGASPDSKSYNIMRDGLPFYQGKTEFGAEYPTPVKWCSEPVKIAQSGDVLLSVRAPIGPVNFANEKCCIGRGLSALRFEGEQRYLYYFLQASETELDARGTGTTFKCISGQSLRSVPIPIPPLAEQKRIVAKIDAAFEKIDKLKANAEKNLANAKELFQSALDEAMRPKDGWVEKRLGEVCIGKLSYGTCSPSRVYDARVRYIRITDIDDNGRLLNDLVSPKEYDAKHVLKDGDLVFARTGATVGKSYMYSLSDGVCVYAGYLIRARVDESIIRPKYLFYFTKTSRYKLFIQQSQATAAQPNVNAEKYSNMLVPIPPVHEQDEIMSCIGRIQELSIQLQQNYTKQIADCVEMRQAVLREAFEGRL